MRKGSLIDDTEMMEQDYYGIPIMFQNPQIRKMFNLVKLNSDDIFYDLGSGWAQNIIIALTEYKVKEAVGIEENEGRLKKSCERLEKRKIPKNEGRIVKGKFENLFKNKLEDADITKATVVFYGLQTDKQLLDDLEKNLKSGCRLLYYYNCLFPEIMPISTDFPFFVSKKPFRHTKSKLEWLKKVTLKKKSSISKELSEEELWDEIRHDYDIEGDRDDVKKYQKRLNDFLNKSH
ncbi:MAG: hypothetical protein HY223_05375 [Thaumarchaeota archaeon]|nr:hypothetical protein [Nitrososphaerota archaeon]